MGGSVKGFISGFKFELRTIDEKPQSGLRLYVVTDARKKVFFFFPYDPYFYVIPHEGKTEEAMNYINKNRKTKDAKEGVKNLAAKHSYVFGIGHQQFRKEKHDVIKVIMYVPNEVPEYSKFLKNCPFVYSVR